MANIDQLRHCQEQRLLSAIATLDEAKKHLENAIALTEASEREFRGVSEDVQRNLNALLLVSEMARNIGAEVQAESGVSAVAEESRSMLTVAKNVSTGGEAEPSDRGLRPRSSRSLFSALPKSA